jgi:hypothetical protein
MTRRTSTNLIRAFIRVSNPLHANDDGTNFLYDHTAPEIGNGMDFSHRRENTVNVSPIVRPTLHLKHVAEGTVHP